MSDNDESTCSVECDRRTAMQIGCGAMAGLMIGAVSACGEATLEEDVVVDISEHDELSTDGGLYGIPTEETGFEFTLWIYRRGEDDYLAFSGECTHQGCEVDDPMPDGFRCPCHGSTFDREGNVTGGPADAALPRFDTRLDGDELTVLANA